VSDTEKETKSEPEEPEETPEDAPDAAEEDTEDVDILKEVSLLGQHLGEALKEVWGSDERKNIEKEFVRGVQVAGSEVRELADEVRSGKTTKEIKDGAEKVGGDLKSGLLTGLRLFNRELRKMRKPKQDPPEEEGE